MEDCASRPEQCRGASKKPVMCVRVTPETVMFDSSQIPCLWVRNAHSPPENKMFFSERTDEYGLDIRDGGIGSSSI